MTDWESEYRAGNTPWDKGAPSPALLEALETVRVNGRVLVPGSGLGHDVRALAAIPPVEHVLGLDLAPTAVEAARERSAGVPKAHFEVGDFFALADGLRGSFDWVWEHTCFCAIQPEQRGAYVEAAAAALRPGGQLLGVFYLDPGQAQRTDGPPFETTLGELYALFAKRFELVRDWLPRRTYAGRENREWMQWWRLQSAPKCSAAQLV